jgi:hypothetical protein
MKFQSFYVTSLVPSLTPEELNHKREEKNKGKGGIPVYS